MKYNEMLGGVVMQKLKSIGLPFLMIIIFIGLSYYHFFSQHLMLPSPDWSRSQILDVQGNSFPIQTVIEFDVKKHILLTATDKEVEMSTYSATLNKENPKVFPVQVPTLTSMAIFRDSLFFIRNEQLVMSNKKNETIIAKKATQFIRNENSLLYWSDKNLFQYNLTTKTTEKIQTFNQPIHFVTLGESTILVASYDVPANIQFVELNSEGKITSKFPTLTLYNLEPEQLFYLEKEATVLLSGHSFTQGVRSDKILEIPLKNPIKMKTIEFMDAKWEEMLENPRYIDVKRDKTTHILFTALGKTMGKNVETNVYEAVKEQDQWYAKRISSTNQVVIKPFYMGDIIAWQVVKGSTYTLFGATQNKDVIKASQQTTSEDYKNAFYDTFTAIFTGFFIPVLFAFAWFILPVCTYMILVFTKRGDLDQLFKYTYLLIAIYIASQLAFLNGMFKKEIFMQLAPNYLTFSGSLVVVPLLVALITLGIFYVVVKEDNAGVIQAFTYFASVNLLFIMFLFGPYLI